MLVIQKDLRDSTNIATVFTKEQLEEALGKKLDRVVIRSISPDGKMVDMWVFEPDRQNPREYLASVDLSFLKQITSFNGSRYWSPNSAAIMNGTDFGMSIIRRGKRNAISSYVQGNLLTWSKDGTELYFTDVRGRLVAYNIQDGSQQRTKVSFLDEINATLRDSSKQDIRYLGFSPVTDDIILATVDQTYSQMTIYKTTSDFADASVLSTFDYTICHPSVLLGYDHFIWSPNGQYAFIIPGCDAIIFINVENSSATAQKNFILDDHAGLLLHPCGWSSDNHFVTVKLGDGVKLTMLSFWDPAQLDEPVLSIPFTVCPMWLPTQSGG